MAGVTCFPRTSSMSCSSARLYALAHQQPEATLGISDGNQQNKRGHREIRVRCCASLQLPHARFPLHKLRNAGPKAKIIPLCFEASKFSLEARPGDSGHWPALRRPRGWAYSAWQNSPEIVSVIF
jgi:hypothetical protein